MLIDELIVAFLAFVGYATIFYFTVELVIRIIDKMTRRKEDDKEPGTKTESRNQDFRD
jgi:hypothetical protein